MLTEIAILGIVAVISFVAGVRSAKPKPKMPLSATFPMKDQEGTIVDVSPGSGGVDYFTILFQEQLLNPQVEIVLRYHMPNWRKHPWRVGDKIWVSGGKLVGNDPSIEYFQQSFKG
ncbi:MAG: hypothetical protein JWN89_188 [Parcubacteria group bacterium]|nr:hypothetical protein [Parcubacteria group bacterium]